MNTDLEKKISYLINEFNSQNYNSVISIVEELIDNDVDIPIIYNLLGASYSSLNKHSKAIDAYKNALRKDPKNEEVFRNLGKSYSKLDETDKAHECFIKANKIKPKNADALFGIGLLFLKNKNFLKSIEQFNLAIKFNNSFYQAYYNLAIAQTFVGNINEAQNNYLKAIKINKNYFQAYNNLGSILIKTNKSKEAIKFLKLALSIKQNYIEAITNLGVANLELKQYENALFYFNKALSIEPFCVKSLTQKLYLMRKICDWSEDSFLDNNLKVINNSEIGVTPWQLLSLDDDPKIEFVRAKKYGDQFNFKNFDTNYKNPKIKLAYITSDFYEHAGMINMEGIFRNHDKSQFEIYAFDYGHFNNDATHKRIKKYFDHFYYINQMSDSDVIKLIKDIKIDIVVHRNGYSQNSRNTLFANKLAPVQISFLGYPGTMGVKFIDYIIADSIVIPEENKSFFSEKIIYLPNTYYPTNNERKISSKYFHKSDYQISNSSFVFGSLNNSYKISSREFSIWMNLLKKIKNSYLVLLINDDFTKKNITKEILKHNIDPLRIIFFNFVMNDEHLSRHQIIDLYLDTFNYNGHTSSVDALYSGVPVVTKIGKTFSSRVCASILEAIYMPELIVSDEEQYYNLAFEIATNQQKFKELKKKLKINLKTAPLFNTKKYVRNLEAGFKKALDKKINKDDNHIIV